MNRDLVKKIIKTFGLESKYDDVTVMSAFEEYHNTIALEFEVIKSERSKLFPADDEATIDRIDQIIKEFYTSSKLYFNSGSMDDDLRNNEVAELRAELSSLLYMLSRSAFKELSLRKAAAISKKEKAEGDAYDKIFKLAQNTHGVDGKKYSVTLADSYARKMYKADMDYQRILIECDSDEQKYWELLRTFEQAREVLNAMSKRKNDAPSY